MPGCSNAGIQDFLMVLTYSNTADIFQVWNCWRLSMMWRTRHSSCHRFPSWLCNIQYSQWVISGRTWSSALPQRLVWRKLLRGKRYVCLCLFLCWCVWSFVCVFVCLSFQICVMLVCLSVWMCNVLLCVFGGEGVCWQSACMYFSSVLWSIVACSNYFCLFVCFESRQRNMWLRDIRAAVFATCKMF